jgi:putative hydrolase
VGQLQPPAWLTVRTGVEAKILDMTGRLDLPADLSGIDLVLIADHQFPADIGPVDPAGLRQDLADGTVSPADAVECLAEATANAASTVPAAILAHLFSVLPKIGLSENDVPDGLLGSLAGRLLASGAAVEVNEKWSCPAPRTVAALAGAGVPLVASTDSHHSSAVGRYQSVRDTVGAVFPGAHGLPGQAG